jgi:magnesium-transporting ATPase (P-type)
MTMQEEKTQENEYAVLQSKFMMIMVAISITSAVGVFSASLYVFSSPGVLSGIIFAACLIFLVILPIILLAIYYNKKMKPLKIEEEKKVITLTKSKKSKSSRIDLLE